MPTDREPATREQPSLIDWVVIGLSPALIMLMIGSLVFFLVEVLYQGQYSDRLLYTLFFYVFGIVLISRIAIEQGYTKASIYGLGLGAATLIALQAFVQYPTPAIRAISPVINIALMALIWWAANKLTWDCTHLDEGRKTSGRGVLAAAGLDANAAAENPVQQSEDAEASHADAKEQKKRKKDPEGFGGWWSRWERYREAQRSKPHTPGVWVVYFSLAALPLFALGQSLIDPSDVARRRATFIEMAVYVGSGLGLLVTTSLLGLRKYLRDRGAKIPAAMTAGWLGLGAIIIFGFLVLGTLLPRPHSETPWFGMERAGGKDRKASKYAVVKDGSAGKGEGAAGKKTEAGEGKQSAKGGKEGGGNAGEKGKGGGKGQDSGGNKSDGNGDSKDGGNDKGNPGGEKSKQNRSEKKDEQKNKGGQQGGKDQRDEGQGRKSDGDEKKDPSGDGEEGREADGEAGESDGSREESSSSTLSQALEKIGSAVKWVVWVIVAILVVVGLIIFFLKFLAPFTSWARNLLDWLKGLFARKSKERAGSVEEAAAEEEAIRRPPPFASFANPFEDGSARRMSHEQLVEYTFAAIDSWAWDRGRGRQPGETPNEFAARIGEAFPAIEESSWRLANLFVRVQYSNTGLPADTTATLKKFWEQIEQPIYEDTEEEAAGVG